MNILLGACADMGAVSPWNIFCTRWSPSSRNVNRASRHTNNGETAQAGASPKGA